MTVLPAAAVAPARTYRFTACRAHYL